jgi:hypothetical protein
VINAELEIGTKPAAFSAPYSLVANQQKSVTTDFGIIVDLFGSGLRHGTND